MISQRDYLKAIAVGAAMAFSLVLTSNLSASESKSKTGSIIHTVEIQQFKFVPETIEIKAGDTVRWINKDIVPHTATASDNSWDTGEIKTNESKSITFSKDAISSYFCFYHPGMKANFTITMSD